MNRSDRRQARRQPDDPKHPATPKKEHEDFKAKLQTGWRRSAVK
jgi:hypothetical protein